MHSLNSFRAVSRYLPLLGLIWAAACGGTPSHFQMVPEATGGRASGGRSGSAAGTNASSSAGVAADDSAAGEGGESGAESAAAGLGSAGDASTAAGAGGDGSAANGGTANGGTANGGTANGGTANGGTANGGGAALCGSSVPWIDGAALAISSASNDRFGSLSADERSIAWTINDNGAVTIFYADRANANDPFGNASQFTGAFANDRAALSPDGLQLVLVNADRRGFSEFSRPSLGVDFALDGAGDFAAFSWYAQNSMPESHAFADPLLAPDDKTFIYSEYGEGVSDSVQRTRRLFSGDVWQVGSPWVSADLAASGNDRRRPSGMSADGRTLFFWDDQSAQERAGFLDDQGNQFVSFVDLGPLANAQPNADCTRLYHNGPGSLSIDLFVASRL